MYSVTKIDESFICEWREDRKYIDIVFTYVARSPRDIENTRSPAVPEVLVTKLSSILWFKNHASLVIRVSSEDPVEAARIASLSVGNSRFPMNPQLRFLRDLALLDEHAMADSATAHGWTCLLLHTLEDTTAPCPAALANALDIIESQLSRPLSIDMVARDCAVSKRKLHTLFRDYLGIAPYEYIRKRRAERAIELLAQHSTMSIADIAVETGHQDQSGLTRALKSQFQITPAAYRRSIEHGRKAGQHD